MEIRELTEANLRNERFLTGFLDSLSSLSETFLSAEEAVKIHQQRDNVKTFVAIMGDEVVGTGSLVLEPKFIHNGSLVGHIEDVAVKREFQDQGIGLKLVRFLVEEAKKAKCYKVILDCKAELINFYEKNGFRPWNTAMIIDI